MNPRDKLWIEFLKNLTEAPKCVNCPALWHQSKPYSCGYYYCTRIDGFDNLITASMAHNDEETIVTPAWCPALDFINKKDIV